MPSDAFPQSGPLRIHSLLLAAAPVALCAFFLAGCGNSVNSAGSLAPGQIAGSAFVIGTDAPLAGVLSFTAKIQSIEAIDSNNNSVNLLSGTPAVDFARYNGLQTLLDMNDVPAGTYTQIAVTFGSASIGYLKPQAGAAPTIQTMPAVFTATTVTKTLSTPLVVAQTGPVGICLDFLLDQSIQVDSTGQITGQVNPVLNITAVTPGDARAYIDEYRAGVVSVDSSGQSFVIQGPHGQSFTVNVNSQTEWDDNQSISNLTPTSIVQISGTLDKASSTIDADEVAILSQNGFYAAGQITYVQPASGAASDFQLYVRGTLPASGDGVSLGQLAQVDLTGQENFFVYWMHNPMTQFLFNASSLLPGQSVSVGGSLSGAANAQALSVQRVTLRDWGFSGTIVPGSANSGSGSFQMNITGFAGQLIPGPVTVYGTGKTDYRDGFTGMEDLGNSTNIRVVGLLFRDPISGNAIILARHVDDMKND